PAATARRGSCAAIPSRASPASASARKVRRGCGPFWRSARRTGQWSPNNDPASADSQPWRDCLPHHPHRPRHGYRYGGGIQHCRPPGPACAEADMAMALSGARPSESHLDMTQLLAAARASGADAIHPGYGFLSENPAFARAVAEAGLTLIGPPASAIEAMGDKAAAKALMAQAGVPLVPGYHGTDQSPAAF